MPDIRRVFAGVSGSPGSVPALRQAAELARHHGAVLIPPGALPRTIQLCIQCLANPAGFWVSRTGSQTVRRPWCLSCCQELDPDRYDVIPFDS